MPIDVRSYLVLESALTDRIQQALVPTLQAYYQRVKALVRAGDYDAATQAAGELDLAKAVDAHRSYFRFALLACANFGARQIRDQTILSKGNPSQLLSTIVDVMTTMICRTITLQVVTQTLQSIAAQRPTVQKKEASEYLDSFTSFAQPAMRAAQWIASQHSSRLSTWGFVAEAELAGVTQYRVTAVLDGRTSEFCRFINGHIFEVAQAKQTINHVLSVDDPAAIEHIQPWPNQSKASMDAFREMSSAELVAQNLHIPPYHISCRTLLTLVHQGPRNHRPPPEAAPPLPEPLERVETKEGDFAPMATPTEAQVRFWNDYVAVNPAELYALLRGVSLSDLAEHPDWLEKQSLHFNPNGTIRMQLSGQMLNGGYALDTVFDPYYGKLYMDRLLLDEGSPASASAEDFATLVGGVLDAAPAVGASQVLVQAVGADAIHYYTNLGFIPAATDWFDIKQQVSTKIATDPALLALPAEQRQLIADIVSSKDEQGFAALVQAPISVNDIPLGTYLFEALSVTLALPITADNLQHALSLR